MAVFGGRNGFELPTALAAGFAGSIPAPEFTAELVAVHAAATRGALSEARRLHQRILPAIVFVNHAPAFQLAYRKRALAGRMGIAHVHDRGPALRPTAFGLAELEVLLAVALTSPAGGCRGARPPPSRLRHGGGDRRDRRGAGPVGLAARSASDRAAEDGS